MAVYFLLILMFFGASDVFARYVLNNPINGAIQYQQILMGLTIFLSWAYTQKMRQHITLDLFFYRYPHMVKTIISIIALTLSLGFFGLITWRSAVIAMTHLEVGKNIRDIIVH